MKSKVVARLGAILAFLFAYWAADRLIAAALSQGVQQSELRFSRLYSGRVTDMQIIAIGNSRGVNGFYAPEAERLTGLRACNLSYNGLSMELGELLLGDYLERYEPPRLMVMEITCLLASDGLLKSLRTYQDHSPRIARAVKERYPQLYWAGQFAHCFRYNNELFLRALYYLRRSDQDWINRHVMDPVFAQSYRPQIDAAPFDLRGNDRERNLAALDRLVATCKHKRIELRLLVSPYLPAYVESYDTFQPFVATIEARTGLRVWDYSGRIRNLSWFADPLHMNASGCRQYMALLEKDGFFPAGKK